ncbi:hypothetical protein ACWD5B_28895 [Streptomyces tanashiensis]
MSDTSKDLIPLTVEELTSLHNGLFEQQLSVLKGLSEPVRQGRTLPSCPRCGKTPMQITQSHRNVPEIELSFDPCGHRFRADEETTLTAFRGPRRRPLRVETDPWTT